MSYDAAVRAAATVQLERVGVRLGVVLERAVDTVGEFARPLRAIGLMILFANDIRSVFWFAIIPAAIAVLLVVV